ncbi:hypothetical protein C4569_03070 [Candidatus Parcubacteria bacterium]|nr:MAG: hypothetical protein C4569_03070 [Candidatus Parcubacteria bacterium]
MHVNNKLIPWAAIKKIIINAGCKFQPFRGNIIKVPRSTIEIETTGSKKYYGILERDTAVSFIKSVTGLKPAVDTGLVNKNNLIFEFNGVNNKI